MVTLTIFLLSIHCKKNIFSIFNTLEDTKTLKSLNALKVELFGCAVSLRVLKIEHFFLFAMDR